MTADRRRGGVGWRTYTSGASNRRNVPSGFACGRLCGRIARTTSMSGRWRKSWPATRRRSSSPSGLAVGSAASWKRPSAPGPTVATRRRSATSRGGTSMPTCGGVVWAGAWSRRRKPGHDRGDAARWPRTPSYGMRSATRPTGLSGTRRPPDSCSSRRTWTAVGRIVAVGAALGEDFSMPSAYVRRLDLSECETLIATLGDSPETVIAVHQLRHGLCEVYVEAGSGHHDAVLLRPSRPSDELMGFGPDVESLGRVLLTLSDWSCVCVENGTARRLGPILEAHLGCPVRYYHGHLPHPRTARRGRLTPIGPVLDGRGFQPDAVRPDRNPGGLPGVRDL